MLHNDVNALKTCTLVCHEWLAGVRYNLFTGFNLDPRIAVNFSTLEDEIASLQRSSLPFFIIQCLKLMGGNMTLFPLLWPCWGQLNNVTEVHLQEFDGLDTDLPSFLEHLSQLRFLGAQFMSLFSILRIIENTPQLSELSLLKVSFLGIQTSMRPTWMNNLGREILWHRVLSSCAILLSAESRTSMCSSTFCSNYIQIWPSGHYGRTLEFGPHSDGQVLCVTENARSQTSQ